MIAKILVCLFIFLGCESQNNTLVVDLDSVTSEYVCAISFKHRNDFIYVSDFVCRGEYDYESASFLDESIAACEEYYHAWDRESGLSCTAHYLLNNNFFIESVEQRQDLISQIYKSEDNVHTVEKKFRIFDFLIE